MKYCKVVAKGNDSWKETYYVAAHDLFQQSEILEYVSAVVTEDFIKDSSDEDELFELDPNWIDGSEYYGIVFSENFREKLSLSSLINLTDVFLSIGKIYKKLSDDRYFLFSAQAGQDADVNSVGKTDKDKSIQEVMEEGYADCLYQLRQYFQPAGLAMCTGVFTIQALDEEDYQYELSERELVLA